MESFFSSVKSEVADRFDSCGEAKMELRAGQPVKAISCSKIITSNPK